MREIIYIFVYTCATIKNGFSYGNSRSLVSHWGKKLSLYVLQRLIFCVSRLSKGSKALKLKNLINSKIVLSKSVLD